MEAKLASLFVDRRYFLSIAVLALTVFCAIGATNLYLNNNYNIFFTDDDPQKLAHELQQNEYIKTDNIAFLVNAKDGDLFDPEALRVIHYITEQSWKAPYAIRVDSLTNYQYSRASDDELIIEDLVLDESDIDNDLVQRVRTIALQEKELVNRVIAEDGSTTLINVALEFPAYPEKTTSTDEWVQKLKDRDKATADVTEYGRALVDEVHQMAPNLIVHLMGETVINQSLTESSDNDAATLIPLMFVSIVLALAVLLRSVGGIVGAVCVITLAIVATMGAAGWVGYSLNMVNMAAPIIILTIAVCDSVHLLSIYLNNLGGGDDPIDAMTESLRVNMQPVFITSVTTAVGFLTLNFSASPPFREFGNICAFGVMYAMLLTLCLLPTITLWLVRKRSVAQTRQNQIADRWASFVIKNRKASFFITLAVTALLVSFIPKNQVNDDPAMYFKSGNAYRDAVDFSQSSLAGINDINFSLNCGQENCVHAPDFLRKVEGFSDWLSEQPDVEYVVTYTDTIKRINRNMHNDDPNLYQIPNSKDLSAQYNLLYELSLPFGLELSNLVNFDKSGTRVTAFTQRVTTGRFLELESSAYHWLEKNYPDIGSRGSSIRMMFSSLGEANIYGMLWGALIALIGVTLTILLALRSVKYALISFIPNCLPAAIGFGIWGATVAHVNMAVAAVFSITLGIIVDDSVHFISKYRRARQQQGASPEQAVRYAFTTVGPALLVTTVVLTIGFSLLCLSDFNLNAYLGALTAITVAVALIFDFLVLPPLLIFCDSGAAKKSTA